MILSVLLTILKIIGIVLLCILGLIILILLIVLFVPIRYSASGYRTGAESDPPIVAKARVSWILHIIHVTAVYPGEPIITVRLFGIPIIRLPKPEPTEEEKQKAEEKRKKKEEKEASKADKKKKTGEDGQAEQGNETPALTDKDNEFLKNDEPDETPQGNPDSEEVNSSEDVSDAEAEKTSIFSRIRSFINKIRCTISDFYATIKKLKDDKIKSAEKLKKNIHYYYRILTSELFERTFEKTKKKLFKLLKEILPKKFDVRAEVGFDDPYTTGEVMAIAGMLYPLTYDHVQITGNFEEQVIRAAFKLRGRIFGFSFLKIAIYYLTDRDLKRLIKLLKKEEKPHGRKQ